MAKYSGPVDESHFDRRHFRKSEDRVARPIYAGDAPPVGAGEAATAPAVAALANAFFDATGVRLRGVPFTASRVEAALAKG